MLVLVRSHLVCVLLLSLLAMFVFVCLSFCVLGFVCVFVFVCLRLCLLLVVVCLVFVLVCVRLFASVCFV